MFREISLNEIEMVTGGNRYASSCDDDSGYFWKEASTAVWDWLETMYLKDLARSINSQSPELQASVKEGKLTINAQVFDLGTPDRAVFQDYNKDGTMDSVDYYLGNRYLGGTNLTPDAYLDDEGLTLSVGWSVVIAGGVTAYNDGMGVFLGGARPGPVIGVGTATSGNEAGWDVGPDGIVYQSGPLPIAGYEKVYHDEKRGLTYMKGEVYYEPEDRYVTPTELKSLIEDRRQLEAYLDEIDAERQSR